MTLSNPLKALVGVLTTLVVLIPFGFVLLWGLMAIPAFMGAPSNEDPFRAFDLIFAFAFPLMCVFSLLMYAMIAFYVAHAIKNQGASDVVRIVALLLIYFLPYLGMPAYYVLFILLPQPPAWALKPQPTGP